jgi:hypothetical protein
MQAKRSLSCHRLSSDYSITNSHWITVCAVSTKADILSLRSYLMDLAKGDWYEIGRSGCVEPCILHEGLPLIEVEIQPLVLCFQKKVNSEQILSLWQLY